MAHRAPKVDEMEELEVPQAQVDEPRVDIRLSLEWDEEDADAVEYIKQKVHEAVDHRFPQMDRIERELYDRTLVPNVDGPGFQMNVDGSYVRDWGRVTMEDLRKFILAASAEAYFASDAQVDALAEAAFAKYDYDDAYDQAYSAQLSGTIGDKTARAKRRTQGQRWLALFKTLYKKCLDEKVENLETHRRSAERIYAEMGKQGEREYFASRGL